MKREGFPHMCVPSLKTHAICTQVFTHLHITLHPPYPTSQKKKENSKMISTYTALFLCKSQGVLNTT